jgi:carboxyl-terminal processing protease
MIASGAKRMCSLIRSLIPAIVAFATGVATAETSQGPVPNPPPASILGVWKQTSGGVYLTIAAEAADFYHSTRFVCYKDDPPSGKPLADSYVRYRLEDDGSKLVLFRYDLADRFDRFFAREEFRRVAALPANIVSRPREDVRFQEPEFIFEVVWHHFDEQFGFFKQRHFDWQEQYRRFRPRVAPKTTEEELYGVLTGMLTGLGDSHTRVYWDKRPAPFRSGNARVSDYLDAAFAKQTAIKDGAEFRGNWAGKQKATVESDLAEGPFGRAAAGKIRWGKLKGGVGYIELDALNGFGPPGSKREAQVEILEHEVDRIIEAFQGCPGVIIDLSFNQGGFDPFGAVIASRFADQRRHVLSAYSTGEDPSAARTLFISPGGPRQFTRPVYLLTSNATVSAGESLTLMLRAFPHVKHVGESTRGCLSSLLNKGMPNAFHITLSNEFWVAPDGRVFEGSGIRPDVEIPVFVEADLMSSYPKAVRRTLDLVTGVK